MRKSQGIILVPVKGTVVIHTTPAHGSYPSSLKKVLPEKGGPCYPSLIQPGTTPTCPGQTGPTLVDKLVECMLAIGPWLPPHNGACLVVYPDTGLGDILPIGLHVALE